MYNYLFPYSKGVEKQRQNYIAYIQKYRLKYDNKLSDLCLETYCLLYNKLYSEIDGIFYTPHGLTIGLKNNFGVKLYQLKDLDVYSLKNIVLSLKKEFGRV